eukprot:12711-Heterococcus_DN1.PRE.2
MVPTKVELPQAVLVDYTQLPDDSFEKNKQSPAAKVKSPAALLTEIKNIMSSIASASTVAPSCNKLEHTLPAALIFIALHDRSSQIMATT